MNMSNPFTNRLILICILSPLAVSILLRAGKKWKFALSRRLRTAVFIIGALAAALALAVGLLSYSSITIPILYWAMAAAIFWFGCHLLRLQVQPHILHSIGHAVADPANDYLPQLVEFEINEQAVVRQLLGREDFLDALARHIAPRSGASMRETLSNGDRSDKLIQEITSKVESIEQRLSDVDRQRLISTLCAHLLSLESRMNADLLVMGNKITEIEASGAATGRELGALHRQLNRFQAEPADNRLRVEPIKATA